MSAVDILVPTYERPAALAVTLTSILAQTHPTFRVVVSDQTTAGPATTAGEVQAVLRLLAAKGHPVEVHHHLPRRGLAEHRQFLLDRVTAPCALFLDDDVILEPDLVARMLAVLEREGCGFVGSAVIGLSYLDDERPHEQDIELWEGPVEPETIVPGGPGWDRHRLHNAANLWHVAARLGVTAEAPRLYKVAWVGGCVLYDAEALRAAGGYGFWRELPVEHCGEDVLAQLRVMAASGGCGLLPSGAYHQELPTTVPVREFDAPEMLATPSGA